MNIVAFALDGAIDPGFVYANPPDHVREGLHVCRDYGIRPSYALYEPGFTRLGAALAAEYPGTAAAGLSLHVQLTSSRGIRRPNRMPSMQHRSLLRACDAAPAMRMVGGPRGRHRTAGRRCNGTRRKHLRVGLEDAHRQPSGPRSTGRERGAARRRSPARSPQANGPLPRRARHNARGPSGDAARRDHLRVAPVRCRW